MWVEWDDGDYEWMGSAYNNKPAPTTCEPARPAKVIALEHKKLLIQRAAWNEMLQERDDLLKHIKVLP